MVGRSTVGGKAVGRSSATIVRDLRSGIASGRYAVGSFLPSVRQLAVDLKLAPETARRALKALEAEGLVAARPGSGYEVRPLANDPRAGCPLAFLDWRSEAAPEKRLFQDFLLAELKAAVDARGWSLLTLSTAGLSPAEVAERVASARAFGAALSMPDLSLAETLTSRKLPVVILDDWSERLGTDSIMQDGHQGGILAVRHLVASGCRRLAWFGPGDGDAHTLARFGGYASGLLGEGLRPEPGLIFVATEEEAPAAARRMLSGPGRPDGVVALWQEYLRAVKEAADELGLSFGRDLRAVGWCPEERYEGEYLAAFGGVSAPPAVTWSIRTMALTAVARMAERRENPGLPALAVRVPVRLRLAE